MEKTTLSVLAFCLGAGGVAHAQEMINLETLKVLEENQISIQEYREFAERFPNVRERAAVTDANYDTFNSNLTAGNYNTFNSNITAGNYDTFNSNLTASNYDTFNSNTTSGNYDTFNNSPLSSLEIEQIRRMREMPSPQAND